MQVVVYGIINSRVSDGAKATFQQEPANDSIRVLVMHS